MPTVLLPIPTTDSDPTEASVPWKILRAHGIAVVFATPDGKPGQADPRMLNGQGLGVPARDGNYLSARWPGDAHRFATEFAGMLQAR